MRQYSRIFITLLQEGAGYGFKDRAPLGRAIVEAREKEGKLSLWVQDLKPEVMYKVYLIASDTAGCVGIPAGTLAVDAKGKGELKWTFFPDNVGESMIAIEKCAAVVVLAPKKDELVAPLAGYRDAPFIWKNNFTIFTRKPAVKANYEVSAGEPAKPAGAAAGEPAISIAAPARTITDETEAASELDMSTAIVPDSGAVPGPLTEDAPSKPDEAVAWQTMPVQETTQDTMENDADTLNETIAETRLETICNASPETPMEMIHNASPEAPMEMIHNASPDTPLESVEDPTADAPTVESSAAHDFNPEVLDDQTGFQYGPAETSFEPEAVPGPLADAYADSPDLNEIPVDSRLAKEPKPIPWDQALFNFHEAPQAQNPTAAVNASPSEAYEKAAKDDFFSEILSRIADDAQYTGASQKEEEARAPGQNIHQTFMDMAQNFKKELNELEVYALLTEEELEEYRRKEEASTAKQADKLMTELDRVFARSTKMSPFKRQNKQVLWIRVSLQDLTALTDARRFVNHPFVASAYKKYSHLILGMSEDGLGRRQYILGVPEAYDPEFRVVAARMGFVQFKCCDDVAPRTGEYGYWLIPVS